MEIMLSILRKGQLHCTFQYFSSMSAMVIMIYLTHYDVIKWRHFPRYWPFVRGIHLSPVNSPHKGQWRGALMFSLICLWINCWVNNGGAGDLRRYRHWNAVLFFHVCHGQWYIWWRPSSRQQRKNGNERPVDMETAYKTHGSRYFLMSNDLVLN